MGSPGRQQCQADRRVDAAELYATVTAALTPKTLYPTQLELHFRMPDLRSCIVLESECPFLPHDGAGVLGHEPGLVAHCT